MAKNNPMVGGPDFVQALCNALERPNEFAPSPPSTGGTQLSLRFREDFLTLLEILSKQSKWNRNQIIDALIQKGLFVLFDRLSDPTAHKILRERVSRALRQPGLRRIKVE